MHGCENLAGRRVTVMGLGRFGGGVGVTRWLAAQGARVLVTDLEPEPKLAESIARIADLVGAGSVSLRLGGHDAKDFSGAELVVANPAVPRPWENAYLRAAAAAGVPITTEIRLLVERLPNRNRVVAITGSVGKSTTSAMIAAALGAGGARVHFGGNIGGSLLEKVGEIGRDDWVVLEVSSAMLHWLTAREGYPTAPGWSPAIAVVTNLVANHLDWHGDLGHYTRSKQQVLRDQRDGDACVLHESLAGWPAAAGPLPRVRRSELISSADAEAAGGLSVPGRHNRMNAAFALRVAKLAGVPEDAARAAVQGFRGLAHRLEAAGTVELESGGAPVRLFNDSKSTTPDSTALAIEAMDDDHSLGAARTHLICGGYDKKIDLSSMARAAARCRAAYTIGATGPGLARGIAGAGGRAVECGTLERAVDAALGAARGGDVILLSPGCASWDQFTNFEERGARFVELCGGVKSGPGSRVPGSGVGMSSA